MKKSTKNLENQPDQEWLLQILDRVLLKAIYGYDNMSEIHDSIICRDEFFEMKLWASRRLL
jgi:hypothetical protein